MPQLLRLKGPSVTVKSTARLPHSRVGLGAPRPSAEPRVTLGLGSTRVALPAAVTGRAWQGVCVLSAFACAGSPNVHTHTRADPSPVLT